MKTLRCIIETNILTIHKYEYNLNGLLTTGKLYYLDEIGYKRFIEDSYVGSYSSYYIKGDDMKYMYYLKEWFIDISDERNNKIEQIL